MNEKITARRNQLTGDLIIGRVNVLAAIGLSVLNLFLRLFTSNIALPLCLYVPDLLFTIGAGSVKTETLFGASFVSLGLMIVFAYVLLWRLSAKNSVFMKILSAFVWIDFIANGVMAVVMFARSGSLVLFINFPYHIDLAVMVGRAKKAAVGLELIPEYIEENEPAEPNGEDESEG